MDTPKRTTLRSKNPYAEQRQRWERDQTFEAQYNRDMQRMTNAEWHEWRRERNQMVNDLLGEDADLDDEPDTRR